MLTNSWNWRFGRWRWYRGLHGGTVRRRVHPTGRYAREGRRCPRAELRPSRPLVREAWHSMRRNVVSRTSHTARSLRPTFRMLHPTKQEEKKYRICRKQGACSFYSAPPFLSRFYEKNLLRSMESFAVITYKLFVSDLL